MAEAGVVVDHHTGILDMLEHVRFGADRLVARRLAEAFGTEYLLSDDPVATIAAASGLFELRSDVHVGDHVKADETLGAV